MRMDPRIRDGSTIKYLPAGNTVRPLQKKKNTILIRFSFLPSNSYNPVLRTDDSTITQFSVKLVD
jgi:hypothetical protein